MKRVYILLIFVFVAQTWAQSDFSVQAYQQFLKENADMTAEGIIRRHAPEQPYYNRRSKTLETSSIAYLDSVDIKFGLSQDELQVLLQNHFVVSERLTFDCFGRALHRIYQNDLPVFVTSDAILYALHYSYDRLLFDIERTILEDKLFLVLESLQKTFPRLWDKYSTDSRMREALEDVDVYVTMAISLLDSKLQNPQVASADITRQLWSAVEQEHMTVMPLFSERNRRLDFSQFTVRGHYTDEFWDETGRRTLGNYFKCMMWLGRMDFYLTPPPVGPGELPWTRDEIRRMVLGSLLLNELLDLSGSKESLTSVDKIITFMVGESDNLTPDELHHVVNLLSISPEDVFDEKIYDTLQDELVSKVNYGQRIMSAFFIVDPGSAEPDPLPVSYRLFGQRFIIDSYILANVVYDRIIYNGQKVWRPMPDPLDALYVLGNENVLPIIKDDLETYKYASQLEALRYLVDAYDDDFWDQSLYNVWLDGIRQLNPCNTSDNVPYFMKTVAWQQQKMNTQLSSWAQLRHDNLLYAKQSYTGGTACSYPHSFVEPYPSFYQSIADFADRAETILIPMLQDSGWESDLLKHFFPRVSEIMSKLKTLAEKELAGDPFDDEEKEWLQKMLFIDGMSGAPPFSGWYSDLFYRLEHAIDGQYEGHDYLAADVHTQPTDQFGGVVGRVLHVGIGQVNLGIFIADSPSHDFQPMVYVGAVMSYYEKITENFKRLTDEAWAELVKSNDLPERPSWVNVYLMDDGGQKRATGPELPGVVYTAVDVSGSAHPFQFSLQQNYPNPFNPVTEIEYQLSSAQHVKLTIYDLTGKQVALLLDSPQSAGKHRISWNAAGFASGVYIAQLTAAGRHQTIKMMLIR